MFDQIKVRKAQIKPLLEATFPNYTGRTFKVEFTDRITFYDTNWGGGSCNQYSVIAMKSGKTKEVCVPAPWVNTIEGKTIDLPENLVVACHTIFCGKDCGVTFYAHPSRQRALVG